MPKFDIELVKAGNKLTDVAMELGLQITGGASQCPLFRNHSGHDGHLTLQFDESSSTFHCSSCSLHGDVIDLVKISRGVGTYEAIRFLASRAGVHPSDRIPSDLRAKLDAAKAPLSQDLAVQAYRFVLDNCSEPRQKEAQWLAAHGISSRTIARQGLRYISNPSRLLAELKAKFSLEQLRSSGLINRRANLLFSIHRLILPYWKESTPVYLQGRVLDRRYRPQEICLVRPIPCPYNVDVLASRPKRLYVCQSLLDTLTLIEHDQPAIGVTGADGFKSSWLALLRGVEVLVAFHADMAGHTGSLNLVQRLKDAGIRTHLTTLPDGFSVNDLFVTHRQFVN